LTIKVPKNAWDRAAEVPVIRSSPCNIYSGDLESGVKFFVLMLEQLGATTEYSCEGHPGPAENGFEMPGDFYTVFRAPIALARRIHACGFFRVEMERRGRWSLRASFATREAQKAHLRWAADSWEREFGPLKIPRSLLAAARRAKTRKKSGVSHAS